MKTGASAEDGGGEKSGTKKPARTKGDPAPSNSAMVNLPNIPASVPVLALPSAARSLQPQRENALAAISALSALMTQKEAVEPEVNNEPTVDDDAEWAAPVHLSEVAYLYEQHRAIRSCCGFGILALIAVYALAAICTVEPLPASVKLSVDTLVQAHRTQMPRGFVNPMSEDDEPFSYGPAKEKQQLTGDEALVKISDQPEIVKRFVHGLLVAGNVTFIKDLYMAPKMAPEINLRVMAIDVWVPKETVLSMRCAALTIDGFIYAPTDASGRSIGKTVSEDGFCPPEVPVSMRDILLVNGFDDFLIHERTMDDAWAVTIYGAPFALPDLYSMKPDLTLPTEVNPEGSPLRVPELLRRVREQVQLGSVYLSSIKGLMQKFNLPRAGVVVLLEPTAVGSSGSTDAFRCEHCYEYRLEFNRQGDHFAMTSHALPVRTELPSSAVLAILLTCGIVILVQLGCSRDTVRSCFSKAKLHSRVVCVCGRATID
jgi:hypothetical protein